LTVKDLNKQYNNKTRNTVEVQLPRIVDITDAYE